MKASGVFAFLFAASASLVASLPTAAGGDGRIFPFNVAGRHVSDKTIQVRSSNMTARATNSTGPAAGDGTANGGGNANGGGIGQSIQDMLAGAKAEDSGNAAEGGDGALGFLSSLVNRRGQTASSLGKREVDSRIPRAQDSFKPQRSVNRDENVNRSFQNGIGRIDGLVKKNTSSN